MRIAQGARVLLRGRPQACEGLAAEAGIGSQDRDLMGREPRHGDTEQARRIMACVQSEHIDV